MSTTAIRAPIVTAHSLHDLPDELLLSIAECLEGNRKALQSLVLTCRRLQDLSEPTLYRSIFFRDPKKLRRLIDAIEDTPRRKCGIRSIDARCMFNRDPRTTGTAAFNGLGLLLWHASKTTELIIESPFCNGGWKHANEGSGFRRTVNSWFDPIRGAVPGYRFTGPNIFPGINRSTAEPLRSLKKLTLHLSGVGREFLTLSPTYAAVFLHPTLEELHISSVNVSATTASHHPPGFRSRLRRLTLEEVNVTIDGLRNILRLPQSLEYLFIAENHTSPSEERYPTGQDYNNLHLRDAANLIVAFALQRHSLRELVYLTKLVRNGDLALAEGQRRANARLDFSSFEKLTDVMFSGDGGALSSAFVRRDTTPSSLTRLSVDTFAFCEVASHVQLTAMDDVAAVPEYIQKVSEINNVCDAAPSLQELKVVCAAWNMLWIFTEESTTPPDVYRRTAVLAGEYMKEKKIRLQVQHPRQKHRFVRPILYDESLPEDIVIYVNDEQGLRPFEPERSRRYFAPPNWYRNQDLDGRHVSSWDAGEEGVEEVLRDVPEEPDPENDFPWERYGHDEGEYEDEDEDEGGIDSEEFDDDFDEEDDLDDEAMFPDDYDEFVTTIMA